MSSSSPLFSSLGRYMDQCSSYVTLKFRIQHKCRFTWEIPYIAPWAYPVTPASCPKTCWTPTATFIRYFAKEAKDQGDVQKAIRNFHNRPSPSRPRIRRRRRDIATRASGPTRRRRRRASPSTTRITNGSRSSCCSRAWHSSCRGCSGTSWRMAQ